MIAPRTNLPAGQSSEPLPSPEGSAAVPSAEHSLAGRDESIRTESLLERCSLCGEPIEGMFQFCRTTTGVVILHAEPCWPMWAIYGYRPVKRFYPWPNGAR